jgi:hypothetical protein
VTGGEILEALVAELVRERKYTNNDDEQRALIRVEEAVKRAAKRVSDLEWEDFMGEDL